MRIVDIGNGKIEVVNGNRVIRLRAEHRVYAEHDLVRPEVFDEFWESVELGHEGDRLVLDCSSPAVHRYRDGLQFEISGLPEEAASIRDYLKRYSRGSRSVVFDLGAYCGVSTYHFAKAADLVIALEPDPINIGCLYRNVLRHRLENVIVICAAAAGENGWGAFNGEGTLGSSLQKVQPRKLMGRTSVALRTLASLVKEYGEPSLIKLDIEGSEIEVLESSRDLIAGLKSTGFVLDTCHVVDGEYTAARVESVFRRCGYLAESSTSGSLCTWAWRGM